MGRWWDWPLTRRRARARPTPQALAAAVLALQARRDLQACQLLVSASAAACVSVLEGTVAADIVACELTPELQAMQPRLVPGSAVAQLPPMVSGVAVGHDTQPFLACGLLQSRWLALAPTAWLAFHGFGTRGFEPAVEGFIGALAALLAQPARLQAAAAPALLDGWPAPWLCIDSRAGRLVHWHPALPAWLGLGEVALRSLPLAALFMQQDAAAMQQQLAQPLQGGAPLWATITFRHANGEPLACPALGVAAAAVLPPGWVLWALLPQPAGPPAELPFDWALDAERQRRDSGAQALHALLAPLAALQHRVAAGSLLPRDAVPQELERVRAAAEHAAQLLAAPAQRASDLLAALQALAHSQLARCGVRCDFACDATALAGARLTDPVKLAGYRACKTLLEHFTADWHGQALELRLDTMPAQRLRCRLSAPGPIGQSTVDRRGPPGFRAGFGLFAVQATVAGVGGHLIVTPGEPPGLLAEFDLPLAS